MCVTDVESAMHRFLCRSSSTCNLADNLRDLPRTYRAIQIAASWPIQTWRCPTRRRKLPFEPHLVSSFASDRLRHNRSLTKRTLVSTEVWILAQLVRLEDRQISGQIRTLWRPPSANGFLFSFDIRRSLSVMRSAQSEMTRLTILARKETRNQGSTTSELDTTEASWAGSCRLIRPGFTMPIPAIHRASISTATVATTR
jgi:hypothetical protein